MSTSSYFLFSTSPYSFSVPAPGAEAVGVIASSSGPSRSVTAPAPGSESTAVYAKTFWDAIDADNFAQLKTVAGGSDPMHGFIRRGRDSSGKTPLEYMIANHKNQIFEKIINTSLHELNQQFAGGRTMAHCAVIAKNLYALQVLDGQAASLVRQDNDGNTPLHTAAQRDWVEGIIFLGRELSQYLDVQNIAQRTALKEAVHCNAQRAITALTPFYEYQARK